jgi:hypothetical protein
MSDIITFFKLIFFLETLLLTPTPIDINDEWISIKPNEPIAAITGGASIRIDVSKYIKSMDFNEEIELFPNGSVEGRLIQKDGQEIMLTNDGKSHSKDSVMLIVSGINSIPTDVEFIEVKLKSKLLISSTMVYWKNGMH